VLPSCHDKELFCPTAFAKLRGCCLLQIPPSIGCGTGMAVGEEAAEGRLTCQMEGPGIASFHLRCITRSKDAAANPFHFPSPSLLSAQQKHRGLASRNVQPIADHLQRELSGFIATSPTGFSQAHYRSVFWVPDSRISSKASSSEVQQCPTDCNDP
jgi:hypothetical protein